MTNSNPNLNGTGKTSGGAKGMGILAGKYYRTRSLSQNLQQIFQGFHYHQQLTQEMQKHKNGSASPTNSSNPIQVPGTNGGCIPGTPTSPYAKSHIMPSNNGIGSPQKDALQMAMEHNPLLATFAMNYAAKPNPAHIHNPNAPLFKSQSFHIPKMKGYNLATNRNLDLYPTRSVSFDYSLNKPKLKLNMPYARTSNLMSLENTINENYDLMKENSPSLREHLDFYAKRQADHFNFDYSVPEYERRNHYHPDYLPKQLSDYPSTPPRHDYHDVHRYHSQSLEDIVRASRKNKKNAKGSKMNLFKDRYAYLETPIIGGSCDNLFSMSGKMMKENPYHDNYSTFHGVTKINKGRIPFGNLYKKRAVYFHDDQDIDLGEESDESSLYSDSNDSASSDSSVHSLGHSCRYRTAHTLTSVAELHRKPKPRHLKRRNSCKTTSYNSNKYSPRASPVQSRASTPQSPSIIPHPLTASFPPDNRNIGNISTSSRAFASTSPKSNQYKFAPPPLSTNVYNNLSNNNTTINNSHGPFNVPTTPSNTTPSSTTSSSAPWNFLTTWQNKTLVRKLYSKKYGMKRTKNEHNFHHNSFNIYNIFVGSKNTTSHTQTIQEKKAQKVALPLSY